MREYTDDVIRIIIKTTANRVELYFPDGAALAKARGFLDATKPNGDLIRSWAAQPGHGKRRRTVRPLLRALFLRLGFRTRQTEKSHLDGPGIDQISVTNVVVLREREGMLAFGQLINQNVDNN